jgi:hypothetical protein
LDPEARPFFYHRPTAEDAPRITKEERAVRYKDNSKKKSKWASVKKLLDRQIKHRIMWSDESSAAQAKREELADKGCCHLFDKPGVVQAWKPSRAGQAPPNWSDHTWTQDQTDLENAVVIWMPFYKHGESNKAPSFVLPVSLPTS